jgi:hypothetical protein
MSVLQTTARLLLFDLPLCRWRRAEREAEEGEMTITAAQFKAAVGFSDGPNRGSLARRRQRYNRALHLGVIVPCPIDLEAQSTPNIVSLSAN